MRFFEIFGAVVLAVVVAVVATVAQQPTTDSVTLELINAGTQALAQTRYNDAQKAFKSANKREHNQCARCYLGLAVAAMNQRDAHDTISNAERALKYATDNIERAQAHYLEGEGLEGLSRQDPQELPRAENEFRSATQLLDAFPRYHLALGVTLLKESRDADGLAEVHRALELDPTGPDSREARQLIEEPDRARLNFAPDFQLTTLQGQHISLRQLAGHVVVMDFWATWCPPCRDSVDEIRELAKRYANQGLVVISVSGDRDETKWKEFVSKKKMNWAQYRDDDRRLGDSFDIKVIPSYIVIDGRGVIRKRVTGMNPQQTIVSQLKQVLSAMPELRAANPAPPNQVLR